MKFTRILALLLALLTVLTMAVACGGDTETDKGTEKETSSTPGGSSDETDEFEVTDDITANFAGTTNPVVTFFVRTGYESEVWVEALSEQDAADAAINDASYWRTQTVQDRLGITIEQINQAGMWGDHASWNDTLRNAVSTKSRDFDAAMIYAGTGSSLATEGCYMDLAQLEPINLDKSYWNQNLRTEGTIYDRLYFASGSIANSQLSAANVLWYNKDLYNKYYANAETKDIYQVVRDGEWTLDYLYDMVATVWEDVDTNGSHSSGDIVGFGGGAHGSNGAMDSWLYALGCDLTQIDEYGEPVPCFDTEHTQLAFTNLVEFYTENPGVYVSFKASENTGDTSFANGNVMVQLGTFSMGNGLREVTFAYGVLPVPKYDMEQEKYRSIPEVTSSMVTVLSSVEEERLEMVASAVEVTASEANRQVKPVYINTVLKSHQSNAPEDAEMVQVVLDNMVYSFGWIFSSTHMGDMGKAFREVSGSRDIAQYIEQRREEYEGKIEEIITMIVDLDA